jgi:type II secretory ATPase GspE/PulE/Tfp pilus assembly ATPase PilB-like protein
MITDEIRDIIYSQIPGRYLISQIHDQAAESGMETMLQSGIAKVFAGICDLQQVRKACL